MPDDFDASIATLGSALDGIPVVGDIEELGDQDWFAVSLVQGNQYEIEVRGADTADGTLEDPVFVGVYDSVGDFLGGRSDGGGSGTNAQTLYTASYTGIHYFAAGSAFIGESAIGTYELEFNDLGIDPLPLDDSLALNEGDNFTYGITLDIPPGAQVPPILPTTGIPSEYIADFNFNVTVSPGTATPDVDYDVDFTFGYTPTLTIAALEDDLVEDDETILVSVSGTIDWIELTPNGGLIENLDGNFVTGFIDQRLVEFDVEVAINSAPEGDPDDILDYVFTGPEIIGNVLTNYLDGEGESFTAVPFVFSGDLDGELLANGDISITDSVLPPGQNVFLNFQVIDERGAITDGQQFILVGGLDDYLPGDTATVFGSISPGIAEPGEIEEPEDRDRFVVELEAGILYSIDLISGVTGVEDLADPAIFGVFNSTGALVEGTTDNDSGQGLNASVDGFTVPVDGFYEIEVGSNTLLGTGAYELTLNELGGIDDYLPGDLATEFGSALIDVPALGIIETNGDRDRFDIALQAGVVYSISLEGEPTGGGSLLNPEIIGLYNSGGVLVTGTADNNSGSGLNAFVDGFTVASDGIYQVEVASANDIGVGDYTLTVALEEYVDDYLPGISGSFGSLSVGASTTGEIEASGDIDGFRVSLDADTTYQINLEGADSGGGTLQDPFLRGVFESGNLVPFSQTFDDDSGIGRDSLSNFTPPTSGEYFIEVAAFGDETGTYSLSIDELGVVDDYAADTSTDGSISVGGTANGRIDFPADADWFEVNLTQGRLYEIELVPSGGGAALSDPFFNGVYDSNGVLIPNTENDDGGDGNNSALLFSTEQSGTYYLSAGGFTEDIGTYQMVLTDRGGVVDNDSFDISLVYDGPERFRDAFEDAADRWEEVITGDLPFANVEGFGFVDDVLIDITVDDIDLTFQGVEQTIIAISTILEQREDQVSNGALLPTYSRIVVDEEEADRVIRNIEDLAANTIGRALGFGSLWEEFGLVQDINGVPTYTGSNALREIVDLDDDLNGSNVLEDGADGALAAEYWSEAVFDAELMTPRIEFRSLAAPLPPPNANDNPLSSVTIGAMEDLGYEVDYDAADPFSAAQVSLSFASSASAPEEDGIVISSATPQGLRVSELDDPEGVPAGATYIYTRPNDLAENPASFNLNAANTVLIVASGNTVEFLEGVTGDNHLVRLSGAFDKTSPENIAQVAGTVDEMEVYTQSGTLLFSLDYSTKPVTISEVINGWPNTQISGENQIVIDTLPDTVVRFNPSGGGEEANRIFVGASDDFVRGGASAEFINGGTGSDTLLGEGGVDTLIGEGGNDLLEGGGGNDVINGNAGTDTAFYSGDQASYTLTLSANATTIEDRRNDGNGTDQLTSIEFLDFETDFGDGAFNLRVFGGTAGLDADDFESFIELYIAYFNRAPDAVGLNFWGTAFANGTSLEQMATLFVGQPETAAAYPEGTPTLEFVTKVYNNVLGRTPDEQGLTFWTNALDSGARTRDVFILEVLKGAKTPLDSSFGQELIALQQSDQAYLENKIDIGAYFAVHKGMSDVDNASAAMAVFDGSQSSINSAVSTIDGFYNAALNANTGEFLMPLIGVLEDPFA